MLQLIIGALLALFGVVALTSAADLSAFEKRLADAHQWTRVSGWAGTRKGILAWRSVGILLLICGAVWAIGGLSSLNLRR